MPTLKTSTFLRRLALGELSNLSFVSKNAPGAVQDKHIPATLMYLNRALRDLFSLYTLKEKEIKINTSPEINHYFLRSQFALSSDSAEVVKYLDDTGCPDFADDLVKILEIYDGFGREVYMNRKDEPFSVFTPTYDSVQIGANHDSEQFYILYRCLHDELTMPFGNADNSEDPDSIIQIPPALETPLALLTASKIYGAMNNEKTLLRSAQLEQQYEMKMLDVNMEDLASTSQGQANMRFDQKGFA